MKKCNKCKEHKDLSQFTTRILAPKKDGTCGRSYKNNCKDCASLMRVCQRYGISEEFYLNMLHLQNNVCKICKEPESTIDGRYGRVRVLSVDHCHKTGKIRGLLCEDCNRALGLFKENTILMLQAVNYIKESQ